MGFLENNPIVKRLTRADPFKKLLPNVQAREKHARARAANDAQVAAMMQAAKAQSLDLLTQARAAAEQQSNLVAREALKDKAQSSITAPASVDVSLQSSGSEPAVVSLAKRRKQFGFTAPDYTPGVSL